MGIFTKLTNWLYGTTPAAPSNKGTGSSSTIVTTINTSGAKKKAPVKKTPAKKSAGKKTKK